jgi:hypothetical protein
MSKNVLKLFLFIIPVITIFGNVAEYVQGAAGALYPLKSTDLIMENERIVIDAYRGYRPEPPSGRKNADWVTNYYYYFEYDCTYTLRNIGEKQSFLLGFPVKYGRIADYHTLDEYNPMITDFQVKINGTSTEYDRYIHGFNPELNELDYNEVYGFPVIIGKDSTISIHVFYTVVQYDTRFPHATPEIYYILKSGSAYKKPIGKG